MSAGDEPAKVVEADRTALLIMDVQHGIAERGGSPELLERLNAAARAARGAGVRVIYVKIGFRAGYPEMSRSSPIFARIAKAGGFLEGSSSEVHAAVEPQPDDVVVTKRRVSAFASTDLDAILRVNRIDRLVLSGISTSGVVLSTVRAAADLDFELTVLSDGCADHDTESHGVLMNRIFPRQAEVVTIDEWIARLPASAA